VEPDAFSKAEMFAKMKLRYEVLPLMDRTNLDDQEMQAAAVGFYDRIHQNK
jgi:hypothetical protein